VKVSAVVLVSIPFIVFLVYLMREKERHVAYILFALFRIGVIPLVFFIITSPFNIIDFQGFIHSMNYESSVGTGAYRAFYTRSFEYSIPVLFQFLKVLPFALGIPVMLLGLGGFFTLSWKRVEFNVLRVVLIILFLSTAFLYAKWTRFLAPFFPIFLLFATLSTAHILMKIKHRLINGVAIVAIVGALVPGMAYLAIYQQPDVRFVASAWIYQHIPNDAFILFETANGIDVPFPNPLVDSLTSSAVQYQTDSFNYYDLDTVPELQQQLKRSMDKADYIIIPSRRVFANHTCIEKLETQISKPETNQNDLNSNLEHSNIISDFISSVVYQKNRCERLKETYPLVNRYYNELLESGRFQYVTRFTSFPRIKLWGKTFIEFPDEQAEETWSVFDHPVIRIYQKI